jgi:hypothetical protein
MNALGLFLYVCEYIDFFLYRMATYVYISNPNPNVQTLIHEPANRAREGEGEACAESSARSNARRLSAYPLNTAPLNTAQLSLSIIPSPPFRLSMAATARASTTGASAGGGSGRSGYGGVLGRYFWGGMLRGESPCVKERSVKERSVKERSPSRNRRRLGIVFFGCTGIVGESV